MGRQAKHVVPPTSRRLKQRSARLFEEGDTGVMFWLTEFLFAGPLVPRLFIKGEVYGLTVFLSLLLGAFLTLSIAAELRATGVSSSGLQFGLGAISATLFGVTGLAWPVLSTGMQAAVHYASRGPDDPAMNFFFVGSALGTLIAAVLSVGIFWSCGATAWRFKIKNGRKGRRS